MPLFPVMLKLKDKKCLVVGGGKVAERKVSTLLKYESNVSVISLSVTEQISKLASNTLINLKLKHFEIKDVNGFYLVFASTDDSEVNREIVEECLSKNILCCAVDENWRNASFTTPASFQIDDFVVCVSSDGKSCKDSKNLKNKIRKLLNGRL